MKNCLIILTLIACLSNKVKGSGDIDSLSGNIYNTCLISFVKHYAAEKKEWFLKFPNLDKGDKTFYVEEGAYFKGKDTSIDGYKLIFKPYYDIYHLFKKRSSYNTIEVAPLEFNSNELIIYIRQFGNYREKRHYSSRVCIAVGKYKVIYDCMKARYLSQVVYESGPVSNFVPPRKE